MPVKVNGHDFYICTCSGYVWVREATKEELMDIKKQGGII